MAVAVISFIHPWSESKSERVQNLISASLPNIPSNCTTRTYGKPSTRPKAPAQQLSTQKPSIGSNKSPLLVAVVNVYSSGGQQSLGDDYRKAVTNESLYAHPEESTDWSVAGGFVSREAKDTDADGGRTLMLARFECKDAGAAKRKVVEELSKYAAWVQQNEPKTLTYAVLARPDGKSDSNHVIMYERYTGPDAVAEHASKKEFKAMFKQIVAHINPKATKIAEFVEGPGSFAGTTSTDASSKLSAKL